MDLDRGGCEVGGVVGIRIFLVFEGGDGKWNRIGVRGEKRMRVMGG